MLLHTNLNELGGAERVCLGFVEVAKELGFKTQVITMVPPDWKLIGSMFGDVVVPDSWTSIFSGSKRLEKYFRFTMTSRIRDQLSVKSVTINTAGYRLLPVRASIVYEHSPSVNLPGHSRPGMALGTRLYQAILDLQQAYLLRDMNSVLVANTEYYASRMNFVHRRIRVLPPPVDVASFSTNLENRAKIVVTCGRYEQSKNYNILIDIAEKIPKIGFLVLGAATNYQAAVYYEKLTESIRARSVQNLKLLRNVPRTTQIETYRKASVYLHTKIGEDFGIAAIEAMAAGLVPVVHKSGGLWTDVVAFGRYGYGYLTLAEAVAAIETAMSVSAALRNQVIARASEFGKGNFKRKATSLLVEVTGSGR